MDLFHRNHLLPVIHPRHAETVMTQKFFPQSLHIPDVFNIIQIFGFMIMGYALFFIKDSGGMAMII
jgi:hypothetical protein